MIDDVVNEVKTVLETHLPAEVTALDLDPIKEILIAEKDYSPLGFPSVFILPQSTQELNYQAVQHDELHSLLLTLVHQHVDTQTLARQLMKYKYALRKTFTQRLPQTPVQFIFHRTVGTHRYTRTTELEPGAYSREVVLEVTCREKIAEL